MKETTKTAGQRLLETLEDITMKELELAALKAELARQMNEVDKMKLQERLEELDAKGMIY